jgi:hypothetical protein
MNGRNCLYIFDLIGIKLSVGTLMNGHKFLIKLGCNNFLEINF